MSKFHQALLYVLVAGAILLCICLTAIAISSDDPANLGTRGDFVGGFLNPVLTFITFIALLITLKMQSDELVVSREELTLSRAELSRSATALENQIKGLDRQTFQSTTLELFQLHLAIVKSVSYTNFQNERWAEREAFEKHFERLRNTYRYTTGRAKRTRSDHQLTKVAYKRFWKVSEAELGHYMRFLYRFFSYLIRYREVDQETAHLYIKMLRAQLSDYELLLLFYNGLSKKGFKFAQVAKDVSLFDNMPIRKLLKSDHVTLYPASAF